MTGSARAAEKLLGVLRSRWLAYVLSGLALVIVVALAVRYYRGYSVKFFAASLSVAWIVFAASLAAFVAGPRNRAAFNLLLCTAAAVSVAVGALWHSRTAAKASATLPPTAMHVYGIQQKAKPRVYSRSLPGKLEVFRDGVDKTGLRSFSDLPKMANDYHRRWRGELRRQGFSEGEAKAVSLMLFTSTLWAFGNANHPRKVGCITENEDNNWQRQKPTFDLVKRARIGCCTDYAHTLSFILSKNGFENRYLVITGHIFNEAKIDGKWYVLDANTNVLMNSAWNDTIAAPEKISIHVFAHPGSLGGKLHRPLISSFQNYMVNMVLIGDLLSGEVKDGRAPDPEYKVSIEELY